MTEQRDEKYISIDYDRWHNHYLPMEQENERLKQELEQRHIKVKVTGDRFWHNFQYNHWYTIDLRIEIGNTDGFDKKQFIEYLEHSTREKFFTKEDAAALKKELEEKEDVLNRRIKKLPWFIKWFYDL